MMPITEEEWGEWLQSPVTKAFRAWAHRQREELKELTILGHFTRESTEGTALAMAKLVGKAEVYQDLADLDFEDIRQKEES